MKDGGRMKVMRFDCVRDRMSIIWYTSRMPWIAVELHEKVYIHEAVNLFVDSTYELSHYTK